VHLKIGGHFADKPKSKNARFRIWSTGPDHTLTFPPRFPAKAIELLTVDTNDVTEIILPAKNKPDHSVEF
jgi:hypothetical protein